ncbi:CinA family nicotinamide mononucleotide deamidase-related protein [candidate division KSB1 bacterium]|nr:CinA family nicotinamide mononucleotide deamidase-related protein [candidate division KSB1 bacterium]
MKAEIISIGDELLIGETVNTNAAYMGKRLFEVGIHTTWITMVGDDHDDMISALQMASQRADIIITTGGLGPTNDDLTKKVIAQYFDNELILNEHVLHDLEDFFRRLGKPMADVNIEQAYVPRGATVLRNKVGTAPAFKLEQDGVIYFVLPGVPHEMKYFLDEEVLPLLKDLSDDYIKFDILKTTGIAESDLFEKLERLRGIDDEIRIAFLPRSLGVDIRITASGRSRDECIRKIDHVKDIMYAKVPDYIWGENDDVLEAKIMNQLYQKRFNLVVIEMFTGGLVNYRLASGRGSDDALQSVLLKGLVFSSASELFDWTDHDPQRDETITDPMLLSDPLIKEIRTKAKADLMVYVSGLSYTQSNDATDQTGHVNIIVSCDTISRNEKIGVRLYDKSFARERIAQNALRMINGVLREDMF